LEAAIRANVDRAAVLLDDIIKDINRRMFMTEATAFLYDEEPEMKMSQVSPPPPVKPSTTTNRRRRSSSNSLSAATPNTIYQEQ
jgi:hypothetical protein